jgi:uncharacterized RDD family membrane protein YckC
MSRIMRGPWSIEGGTRHMDAPSPSAPPPAPSAPSSGLVYADVPNRVIAYIIDAILVGIVTAVVVGILGGMGLAAVTVNPDFTVNVNYVGALIQGIIGLLISAAYFIYTWTSMRATIGMRVLGMQIGNAGDGKTMTMEQGIKRFIALSAPGILAQIFQPLPAIGILIAILGLGWYIYLIYTTANSPTKQGWHDVFANTQVVKAAKSV